MKNRLRFVDDEISYSRKIRNLFGANLIALWPSNEFVGLTGYDVSGNAFNGVYTGVDLANQKAPVKTYTMAPYYDGVTDRCNVYSAGLAAAYNSNTGTVLQFAKVFNAAVWADGTIDFNFNFGVDGANYVRIIKSGVNTLTAGINYGGVALSRNIPTGGNVAWMQVGLTWNKPGDEFKTYYNGAQVGATINGLGVWVGALAVGLCNIGAQTSAGLSPWMGYLCYTILLNRVATLAEINQCYLLAV